MTRAAHLKVVHPKATQVGDDAAAKAANSPPSLEGSPQTGGGTSSRFARNSAFATLAGLAAAFGSFFSSIVLARILGVEGSGAVAFALWLATLVATIADLGVNASLARYLPEITSRGTEQEAKHLAAFLFRPLLLASLAAFAAFSLYALRLSFDQNGGALAGSAPTSGHDQAIVWLVVGLICGSQVLGSFAIGYLKGMQRFELTALLTVVAVTLQLGSVAVGGIEFGVIGALVGSCIGNLAPAAVAVRLGGSGGQITEELKRRVLRYARYAWAGGLASAVVWSRVEVFFLDRSWGSHAVGLFTIALTFSNVAVQGPMLLTGGLLPYFSERFGRNAIEEMREGYGAATRIMGFLIFPACFGLAAIMPAALPLVYGEPFLDAVPAATLLVIASSFAAVASVGSTLVFGLDRSDFIFFAGLSGAALSILGGLTVIPIFGVFGAACARAVVQIILVIIGVWFIRVRLNFATPLGNLMRLMVAAGLCGIAARLCIILISGGAQLPAAISVGAVVYALSVRLLDALPAGDVARLHSLCHALPRPLRASIRHALRLMFGGTAGQPKPNACD